MILKAESSTPVSAAETKALFADLASLPVLVLAISGGPDSTALLVLAARWRASLKSGPNLIAVTIDHGLRTESAREAKDVARLARKFRIPHRTLRWTARKPKTGLQTAAREMRYGLLARVAMEMGANHVLTAHTRDDQAETVLIRLTRGSGLAGLGAMSRISPLPAFIPAPVLLEGDRRGGGHFKRQGLLLVRPLLDLPKARLLATLKSARVGFADDPSNHNPRFTRVRIRDLMPVLAREGLTVPRVALLARRLARANASIEQAVDAAFADLLQTSSPGPFAFDAPGFRRLPEEVAMRLLGRAIAQRGDEGQVELGKLESLHAALRTAFAGPPGPFRRTLAGAIVVLEGDRLAVERAPPRRTQKLHMQLLTKRKGAGRKVTRRR
jgi:tRNA(Ile)-lysidine synthase